MGVLNQAHYEAQKYAGTLAFLPQRTLLHDLDWFAHRYGHSNGLRCNPLLPLNLGSSPRESEVALQIPQYVQIPKTDLSTDFTNGQFDLILLSEVAN